MRTAAYGSVFVCVSVCVLTAQRLLYQLVLHVAHIKLINVMHAIIRTCTEASARLVLSLKMVTIIGIHVHDLPFVLFRT